jgi:secreted trypsin-like serine protease
MRKSFALLCVLVAAVVVWAMPAAAVTNGELDGDAHPYVGIMVAKNAAGTPRWRCSGTLLGPRLFLTAGHCTEAPAARIEVWFHNNEADIRADGYPFTGQASGTPYVHPDYDPNAFFLRDLGAVVLDEPVPMLQYGKLPQLNELERMQTRRGKQDTTFTAVGYGLQRINPVFVEARLDRMFARPHLLQMNAPGFTGDYSLLLSNNASTGGTCFGDSGGPNFIGTSNVIGGVTSFGLNGNCAGTGGVFRMDRAWSLDWINDEFGALLP